METSTKVVAIRTETTNIKLTATDIITILQARGELPKNRPGTSVIFDVTCNGFDVDVDHPVHVVMRVTENILTE